MDVVRTAWLKQLVCVSPFVPPMPVLLEQIPPVVVFTYVPVWALYVQPKVEDVWHNVVATIVLVPDCTH